MAAGSHAQQGLALCFTSERNWWNCGLERLTGFQIDKEMR